MEFGYKNYNTAYKDKIVWQKNTIPVTKELYYQEWTSYTL